MTRTVAMFISYFGPVLPGFLLLLFLSLFEEEPPVAVLVASGVAFVFAAIFVRVYFAMWYAWDKERSGAWGFLALLGWVGWLLLIVTEDRKGQGGPPIAATEPTPVP